MPWKLLSIAPWSCSEHQPGVLPLAQLAGYVSCRDLVASAPSDELQTPRTAGDPDTTACCPLPDNAQPRNLFGPRLKGGMVFQDGVRSLMGCDPQLRSFEKVKLYKLGTLARPLSYLFTACGPIAPRHIRD